MEGEESSCVGRISVRMSTTFHTQCLLSADQKCCRALFIILISIFMKISVVYYAEGKDNSHLVCHERFSLTSNIQPRFRPSFLLYGWANRRFPTGLFHYVCELFETLVLAAKLIQYGVVLKSAPLSIRVSFYH